MPRNRPTYLALVIVTITLGLFTRSSFLPEFLKGGFIATYAGDALWASMVYFITCVIFHKSSPLKIAIIALTFSYAIEISQLYQADWINQIRYTRLGALILGRGFLWSDFLCYTIGVQLAYFVDSRVALAYKSH
ncbi:MAG: DUF2809 domain-containing protein [Akkermansiaceae bacterium]